jgi:hypothetical protein
MEPVTDWYTWKDRIWTSMEARFGYPGLAPLEQYMLRSAKEQRCVECGDPGTQQQASVLVASVKHYWMCDDCDTYWKSRA